MRRAHTAKKKVRYAVVGQGYIAQSAVLPAFAHARGSCELAALVSDDPRKLRALAKKYRVPATYGYDDYETCLAGVHAVYIALPNSMHLEYTARAAHAGVHVLCEKPMGVTLADGMRMIDVCDDANVKLMIAYRLHFEAANLAAIKLVQSGKLGEPRIFDSTFTMQVRSPNIRLQRALGGGSLHDLGIYCINAARSIFQDEPYEVFGVATVGHDPRFSEVPEMMTGTLRFPGERIATFTSSFGAADTGSYRVIGTKGVLDVDPAYEIHGALAHKLTIGDKVTRQRFKAGDQFAPELAYFAECILKDREPEPSGREGLADMAVILALQESVRTGRPVSLRDMPDATHPQPEQRMKRPPVGKVNLVGVSAPH